MAQRFRKTLNLVPGIKFDIGQAQFGSGVMVAVIFGGILWAIFN